MAVFLLIISSLRLRECGWILPSKAWYGVDQLAACSLNLTFHSLTLWSLVFWKNWISCHQDLEGRWVHTQIQINDFEGIGKCGNSRFSSLCGCNLVKVRGATCSSYLPASSQLPLSLCVTELFPDTSDVWDQMIPCGWGCPVHQRMLRSSLGLSHWMLAPLPSSIPHPITPWPTQIVTTKIVSRQMSLGGGGGMASSW